MVQSVEDSHNLRNRGRAAFPVWSQCTVSLEYGNYHSKSVVMDIFKSLKMAKQVASVAYKTKDGEDLSAFVIAPSNKEGEALNIYPRFRSMIDDDSLLFIMDNKRDI